MRRWFMLTLIMGTVFVLGQLNEYRELIHEGNTIASSPYGSVFYLTTGFHGLHVTGGLVAFVIVLMRSTVGRYTPEKATSAIVVSYYWHFVDVVWIALYATIYIIQ
jgi:cytochrome c oxidase subunit 3